VNSTLLDADFHYLASNPAKLKNRSQVRVHVGTREIAGRLVFLDTDEVQPGMVFSVEPSVKVPGEFGIRIEDLVLVTDDGCDVLNRYDKELRIVP
jgi:Xaa-Pro aminopeptidase